MSLDRAQETDEHSDGRAAHGAASTSARSEADLRLTATFSSIGIELPLAREDDPAESGAVEFKRSSDPTWRPGLPLWQADDGAQRALYGSVLLLDPATRYDIRVTLDSPDSSSPAATFTGSTTTQAETIPSVADLQPTHFVRLSGDDSNRGTSPSTAWATLDAAMRLAPPGAVVQVGPGVFTAPKSVRKSSIVLVAQESAVDQFGQPVEERRRTIVEPSGISTPAGATDGPNPGVWQRVDLVGPRSGARFSVWTWRDSPVTDARQLGVAPGRTTSPERVAHWVKDDAMLVSPAGWAELLFTNRTYNYGFYADGRDLYLRLPDDRDPNTLYVTASDSTQAGFALAADDVRVSGFELRQFYSGVSLLDGASEAVVDHNLLVGNRIGVRTGAAERGPPSVYGKHNVIQDNRFVDSHLWTDDHARNPAIPWLFIKAQVMLADGSSYSVADLGRFNASTAIAGRGAAQQQVIRRNVVDGLFNGVSNSDNQGFDRHAGQDMDVYDNVIRHIADDALEPEGAVINFRAWNNRIEHSSTMLSTGPVSFGPVYLFRNQAWQIGNAGAGRDGSGNPGLQGRVFKYSGKSRPPARIYVLQNTIWTDQVEPNPVGGGAKSAGGSDSPEAFYLRNNILVASGSAFDAPTVPGRWDEDFDSFSTTHPREGLQFGRRFRADVAAYRAASDQGAHTNLSSGFDTPPDLVDPANGDLRLPDGSPLVDAGMLIPNVSDRPGIDFRGTAPDLGAEER